MEWMQYKRRLFRLISLAMAVFMLSSAFLERAAVAAPSQDTTPPAAPEVTGVQHQWVYAGPVTPHWEDAPGTTSTATVIKIGSPKNNFIRSTEISEDGSYILSVTARKNSNGLRAVTTIHFTIDSVPPGEATIAVEGNSRVMSGVMAYYTASLTWTEQIGTTSTAMLRKDDTRAVPYTMGALIDQDGDYALIVTTTKQSNGLTSTASHTFKVDVGPAGPQLSGFSDNAILFSPLEMAWTPGEGTQIDWTRLVHKNRNLNYINPRSPKTLNEAGEYEFFVYVREGEKNAVYEYKFMVVEITGLEEGGAYSSAAPQWYEPKYFGEVESVALTKDGGAPRPYVKGETIVEPGEYVLTVNWRADAGSSASKSVRFTIVPAPPAPQLSGFSDNAILLSPLEMAWTPSEGTQIDRTSLLHRNRNSYYINPQSPRTLNEAGEYVFYVSVNKDGVTGRYEYKFMLVEIRGVEEGGVYASVTPEWYEPKYFGEVESVTLTKDGGAPRPYEKGEMIDEPGEYVLSVTWRIDADSSKSKSIGFTIVSGSTNQVP